MNWGGPLRGEGGSMIMDFMPRYVLLLPHRLTVRGFGIHSIPARSIQLIHALSAEPHTRAILFLAGSDNSDDHFPPQGADGMAKFRC